MKTMKFEAVPVGATFQDNDKNTFTKIGHQIKDGVVPIYGGLNAMVEVGFSSGGKTIPRGCLLHIREADHVVVTA